MKKLLDWFRNYIITNKAIFLSWGLVLSYSLAEYAVVYVLIDFLDAKENFSLSLREAAMVVNLIFGGSAISVVIVTHVSEAWTGSLIMICVCTAAYVVGLLILYVTQKFPSLFSLFYLAVGIIAFGRAGRDPPLQSFIEFQLRENMKQSTGSFDGEIHLTVWWKTAWISGAVIAMFALGKADCSNVFLFCGTVMGASYLVFLIGFKYYHKETPKGSPLPTIYRVFKAALLKLNLEYPTSAEKYWKDEGPNDLYPNKAGELHLLPHAPFPFRFLDKAAIISEASNISPEMQERKGKLCAVKEVKEVKRLMPVVYLGLCFFAYSLVGASGITYFLAQTSNLNGKAGSFDIPVNFLFVLKSFVRDVVIFSFWWFGLTQQRIITRRIGAGMFCAVLCCITAWQVEHHRLLLIKREGVLLLEPYDQEDILHMSILVLIPQYFLLGLMEGLVDGGLGKFFNNCVPESFRKFEQPFVEVVLSIGKFLSIPYALIFGSWFKKTINTSRLDKYFLVLAILNFVFLCIYLIFLRCSSRYKFNEKYQEDEPTMEQTQEAIHKPIQEESGAIQEESGAIQEESGSSQVPQC